MRDTPGDPDRKDTGSGQRVAGHLPASALLLSLDHITNEPFLTQPHVHLTLPFVSSGGKTSYDN